MSWNTTHRFTFMVSWCLVAARCPVKIGRFVHRRCFHTCCGAPGAACFLMDLGVFVGWRCWNLNLWSICLQIFSGSWEKIREINNLAISGFCVPPCWGIFVLDLSSADKLFCCARFVRFFSFITLLLPGPQVTKKGWKKTVAKLKLYLII